MDLWRKIWREGFVPQLSTHGLRALRLALIQDDPRLIQGAICSPPLLDALVKRVLDGTCALGFCGWQGEGLDRVGDIELYFQDLCDVADVQFGEPAACRYFLNWYDDTPRAEMRRELLAEVARALKARQMVAA